MRPLHLLWSVALCAALTSCTDAPARPRPTPSTTATPTPTLDAGGVCARATATATTGELFAVGAPNAPTIGPLSFHLDSFQPGFVTKMLIHPVRDQQQTIVLTGQRCTDRRPLRFWYGRNELPPTPPLTEQQLQSLGDLTQSLPPTTANVDHGGYVLFSGAGKWEITVREGNTDIGVLLVTVVQR